MGIKTTHDLANANRRAILGKFSQQSPRLAASVDNMIEEARAVVQGGSRLPVEETNPVVATMALNYTADMQKRGILGDILKIGGPIALKLAQQALALATAPEKEVDIGNLY